jgi:hypothetical protein
MKIPTEKECLDIFEDYSVPKNIVAHCLSVRNVAVFLARKLFNSGITINIETVDRLALLHDAFKVVTLNELKPTKHHNYEFSSREIEMWKKLRLKYPGKYEGEVASEILSEKYPEFAKLLLDATNPHKLDRNWEECVIHYADYRIFRNVLVTLDERFSYFSEVYPKTDQKYWDKYLAYMKEEERRIMTKLPFCAEKLKEEIYKEKNNQLNNN